MEGMIEERERRICEMKVTSEWWVSGARGINLLITIRDRLISANCLFKFSYFYLKRK